jgi:prepilin-type N-terminal cleavage/methylation domain-containing protein
MRRCNNYKKIKNHKNGAGFTLIEALVSLVIISVIMSTVLFNYGVFSDNLALSSSAQEVAVTIRQAQTYGLTVREVSVGGGAFDKAYGVYFNKTEPGSYYLFADSSGVANKKYDVGTGVCGSITTECIEKFTLRNGVTINDVCNEATCSITSTAMNVTFLRPNPDAKIYFTDSAGTFVDKSPVVSPFTGYLSGWVVLRSPKGKRLNVTIESTGQVLVGQVY